MRRDDTWGGVVNGFSGFLQSLGMARLAALGLVAAALLGFFAFIGLRMTAEPMALLYSDIGADDAAKMAGALDAMNVAYQLKGDGTMIYVPESSVPKLRMAMAAKGLPAGGTVGYEIFDNTDALGTTSFLQNINHLRALEGELARTIRSIDGIEGVRVHLVMPERELFSRDKREPSASIVLKVRGGSLATQQVRAIQYLIASAVEGLTPGHVSIVDERGTLLASGMGDNGQSFIAATVEEQRASYETRLRTHVEDIVQRVVGMDKARVEVTAQMDYNRVTQTSDIYDPNGQVVRSTQTVEDSSSNSDGKQTQGVTVGNNLPNANAGAADAGTTSRAQTNRNEETVNYEISRTTKTEVLEPGRVKRLSVAVLVDGTYTTDADGKTVYAPRADQEIAKIEALVKSSIGFDAKRGDHVEVVNLRFAEPPAMEAAPAAPEPFLGLTKADYIRIGELAVLSILALIAMFFVVRPILGRMTSGSTHAAPPLALAHHAHQAGGGHSALPAPDGTSAEGMPALTDGEGDDETMIDIAQVVGKVKHSSVKKIGELVTGHPDESISILRSWLHETA